MTTAATIALVVAIATMGALLASWVGSTTAFIAMKALASAGFVTIAWFAGAGSATWTVIALVALVIAAVGDVILALPLRGVFVIGVLAFLAAYATLAGAFIAAGLGRLPYVVGGGVVAIVFGVLSWWWLRQFVTRNWVIPLAVYHVVVALMLAAGIAASFALNRPLIRYGAFLLALSDVAVARERFVAPGIANKMWGLPLYYAGMVMVAISLTG